MSRSSSLVVSGAREHNLKDVSVTLPRDSLVVITGLSGSGKSSLAFDTIYAEGQRRYVESLSAYARQFLGQMDKPDVDSIEGLSPAISIDQKTTSRNPRSTVGTVTEIYDYLRLLWARIGKPHCFNCGRPIAAQSAEQIIDQIMGMDDGERFMVLAPIVRGRKGEYGKQLARAAQRGLHAREDRRRAADARGRHRARQEVQARHLGGGRPAGDAARPAQAPGRLGGDRGRAGRRDGRDRDRAARRRPDRVDDVLGEVRLPVLRDLDARARAAVVLVQLAARCLPTLHRARVADGDRPRARGAGPVAVAQRGRDPAVVERGDELLRADDDGDRRALRDRPRRPVGRSRRRAAEAVPVRHERRPAVRLVSQPDGSQALVHDDVRGHRHQPRAPLQGDRLGLVAREDRGVHVGAAVPGVQGRAAAAGVAGGQGRRPADPRVLGDERTSRAALARGARPVGSGSRDRAADPPGDQTSG